MVKCCFKIQYRIITTPVLIHWGAIELAFIDTDLVNHYQKLGKTLTESRQLEVIDERLSNKKQLQL